MAVRMVRHAGYRGEIRGALAQDAWWSRAITAYYCEGLDPTAPRERRPVSQRHRDIDRGDEFLRKRWWTPEGIEFYSRHCEACALEMGVERKRQA